jgi:hypothetical protein
MVLIKVLDWGSKGRSATDVFQMLFSGKTGHPSSVGPIWALDTPAKTYRTAAIIKAEKMPFHCPVVFIFGIKTPRQIYKK